MGFPYICDRIYTPGTIASCPLLVSQTLNANPDLVERESEIVGQAGRLGVVTVATNMAGRGTDILLGGNAAVMARIRVRDALAKELLQEEDLAVVPKVG